MNYTKFRRKIVKSIICLEVEQIFNFQLFLFMKFHILLYLLKTSEFFKFQTISESAHCGKFFELKKKMSTTLHSKYLICDLQKYFL